VTATLQENLNDVAMSEWERALVQALDEHGTDAVIEASITNTEERTKYGAVRGRERGQQTEEEQMLETEERQRFGCLRPKNGEFDVDPYDSLWEKIADEIANLREIDYHDICTFVNKDYDENRREELDADHVFHMDAFEGIERGRLPNRSREIRQRTDPLDTNIAPECQVVINFFVRLLQMHASTNSSEYCRIIGEFLYFYQQHVKGRDFLVCLDDQLRNISSCIGEYYRRRNQPQAQVNWEQLSRTRGNIREQFVNLFVEFVGDRDLVPLLAESTSLVGIIKNTVIKDWDGMQSIRETAMNCNAYFSLQRIEHVRSLFEITAILEELSKTSDSEVGAERKREISTRLMQNICVYIQRTTNKMNEEARQIPRMLVYGDPSGARPLFGNMLADYLILIGVKAQTANKIRERWACQRQRETNQVFLYDVQDTEPRPEEQLDPDNARELPGNAPSAEGQLEPDNSNELSENELSDSAAMAADVNPTRPQALIHPSKPTTLDMILGLTQLQALDLTSTPVLLLELLIILVCVDIWLRFIIV
jgi:hypothetical protein